MTRATDSMDAEQARVFEAHRKRLVGLGYRMLGTLAGAEDVVQEAWLRWHRTPAETVREPGAWLTATVTRLCIDELRAQKVRRDAYVGPWLPEPWIATDSEPESAPAERLAELADDLSVAFLLVLERLAPEERAAFLLHDVFEASYADIAATLGKTEVAVRQLVTRARQRAATARKRFDVTVEQQAYLARRFRRALAARDEAELLALFRPDAELVSDGGGKALAALRPIRTHAKIVRFLLGVTRDVDPDRMRMEPVWINGGPGFVVLAEEGLPIATFAFEMDADAIHRVFVTRNPDKLARVRPSR
jgi:RNA polymerase sigma-70 factor, ECF subfamily